MVWSHLPFNFSLYHLPSSSTQSSRCFSFSLRTCPALFHQEAFAVPFVWKASHPKTSGFCFAFSSQFTCQSLKEDFFNSLIRLVKQSNFNLFKERSKGHSKLLQICRNETFTLNFSCQVFYLSGLGTFLQLAFRNLLLNIDQCSIMNNILVYKVFTIFTLIMLVMCIIYTWQQVKTLQRNTRKYIQH